MEDLPGVTIRDAMADDLPDMAGLWFRSWHAAFPDLVHPMPRAHWFDRLRDDIAPRCRCRLAIRNGRIAGFIALKIDSATLEQIFVDPAQQGAAIGQALMADAKHLCPSGLRLTTLQRNTKAAAFYRREGILPGATGINPTNGLANIAFIWQPG